MTAAALSHAALASIVAASYGQAPSVEAGDNVRAVYVPGDSEFVIAVPGTTDLAGWLRDFSAWPAWFPTIGVCHEGFGSGGLALWTKIKRDARAVDAPLRTYVGHSLGGALALVLAVLHAAEKPGPFRVITFGAPRIPCFLDPFFRSGLRKCVEAVEYARAGDPVPNVPTRPFYQHCVRPTVIGTPVPASILHPTANHAIALYCSDLASLERKAA